MTVTTDKAYTTVDRYYAPTQVGRTRRKTPEGALICEGVVIARVCDEHSQMIYGSGRSPGCLPPELIKPGGDGLVRISRTADVLFAPDSVNSFEGKAITIGHPPEDVTPKNWKKYAVGTVMNVRQGTGDQADLLLADFMIQDERAIADVDAGKKQVSCGYDAGYEQIEPGRGRQTFVIGNHVALVDNGRGGHRVAIGDEAMADEHKTMLDKVKEALGITDSTPNGAGGVTINVGGPAVATKTGDEAPADPLAEIKASISALADSVKALAEAKSTETFVTTDAADVAPILAKAEILSPGIKFPTQDTGVAAADHVTACQRHALKTAYTADAGRKAIDIVLGGRAATFDTLDAPTIDAVFHGSASLVGALNNGGIKAPVSTKTGDAAPKKALTIADINARNAEHYGLKH